MLHTCRSQPQHPGALDGPLPTDKFLEADAIAITSFLDREECTSLGRHDFGLAARCPALETTGRQRVERQKLA
jgi:hypothetical protein